MVTLVTTSDSDLIRRLRSKAFRRGEIDHQVAATGMEALALIRRHKPVLAILELDLPDLDGCSVCRRVKSDFELRDTKVLLVAREGVLTAETAARLGSCGCDGMLVGSVSTTTLYEHIAPIMGLPYRRSRRHLVDLPIELRGRGGSARGRLVDLSTSGGRAKLNGPLTLQGDAELVVLRPDGGQAITIPVQVLRMETAGRETILGFRFLSDTGAPAELDAMCLWRLAEADERATVWFKGSFDESTNLEGLRLRLRGMRWVELDLHGLARVNSRGVGEWCAFLRALGETHYTFVRCSVPFVQQASMVPAVLGTGVVRSTMAPYRCRLCDLEQEHLVEVAGLEPSEVGDLPLPRCDSCGDELELDDDPARFFAFLSR